MMLQTASVAFVAVTYLTILNKELVVTANDQCTEYRFKSPFYPGVSCEDIYNKNPESRERSGYYWITNGPSRVYCGMGYTDSSCEDIYNNNPETGDKLGYYRINGNQWTYCNMTAIAAGIYTISTCAGVGGGWRRIAHFNITAGDDCPSGWTKDTQSGFSFCRPPGNDPAGYTCYSTHFPTNGTSYTSVCGRARGYQKGDMWGFWGSTQGSGNSIEGSYVDGLSITHGSGPRHHIWTYAVGHYDASDAPWACPCSPHPAAPPPSYVNSDYYCESGATSDPSPATYFSNDTLWDGLGCSTGNMCCSNNLQPWFYRNLGNSTTDDIKTRICLSYATYARGAVVVDQLELYIQ